jgi:hypothetical protein
MVIALSANVARADDVDDFLLARDNFVAGEFAQAAVQLRRLVGVEPVAVRQELIEPARKYYAAALFSMGQRPQAEQVIEAILRDNPDALLSPALFSPPLQSLFYDVRQRMLPVLNAIRDERRDAQTQANARRIAQQALLRELATREVVALTYSPATIIIPFGGAQFVQGNYGAGAAFLSAELVLGGIAIGSAAACGPLVRDLGSVEPALWNTGCIDGHPLRREYPLRVALEVINATSWALFGATMVGGLVHAIVTFRPERREVRTRPAPRGFDQIRLAVAPSVANPGLTLFGSF